MKGQEWKGQDPSPLRYLLVSATTQAGSRCVSSSARHPRAQAVVTPTVGFVQRGDDVLLLREPSALIISMVQTRNSPRWLEGAGAECTSNRGISQGLQYSPLAMSLRLSQSTAAPSTPAHRSHAVPRDLLLFLSFFFLFSFFFLSF